VFRRSLVIAWALVPAMLPLSASAATTRAVWSTVNICDTEAHPNAVGIRGSMPGNDSRRQTMHMRLRVQYLLPDGTWAPIAGRSTTGFRYVGRARNFVRREFGHTFELDQPPEGETVTVRGVADFQWRVRRRRRGQVRSRVVRRARAVTEIRSEPVDEADPPGYSADRCEIR
jgi:hypothetical protein